MTLFYCSSAKHLGRSFPSLFTWEEGERALTCNKSHLPGKAESYVPWLLRSFDHKRICWILEDVLHPVTLSFLEQGDPSSSVSCKRKEAVMAVQRSHMLCKGWKVLCWTNCFPLDWVLDSAELEINVFWRSLRVGQVIGCDQFLLHFLVHFCAFSFSSLSRSGSRTREQSGGNTKNLATSVAFSIWQKLISFLLPSQISQWVSGAM